MGGSPRIPVMTGAAVPLPSYSFPNLPLGFVVCDDDGQYWRLSVSAAPVDHVASEACAGNPHLRWLAVNDSHNVQTPEVAQ